MARIDEAGQPSHGEGRTHDWHWVSLAALVPLLHASGGTLPPPLSFEAPPVEGAPAVPAPAPLPPELILCLDDDTLGITGRLALLRLVREYLPDVPLLLLVREITAEDAVEALRAGATDLLSRRDWPSLPLLVDRALTQATRHASARASEQASRLARLEREREGEMRRLRASEEKYRALFEHAPEPLAVVQSVTGTVLLANRALLSLLSPAAGTATPPAPALVGRHLSALFPPEAEAEADRFLLRLREEGGEVEGRYFLRQDGAAEDGSAGRPPLPVDLRAAPMPWGATGAVVVAFRNAGLREETGAGAALAYFTLDRLGEGTRAEGAWVLWTDADGGLLHANRPFCEALNRPLTLLRGRHIGEIAPALGPAAWALHQGEARAYGSFQIETAFHVRDGTPLPAEATAYALTLGGREYHCFIGQGLRSSENAPAS